MTNFVAAGTLGMLLLSQVFTADYIVRDPANKTTNTLAFSGVIVFLASLMFTSWNESNRVSLATNSASARDNLHGISCNAIDLRNEGLLVHAACNISNFKSFQGLPGLVRYTKSDLMGIRLEQKVEVSVKNSKKAHS
jgi:hypothetical protein